MTKIVVQLSHDVNRSLDRLPKPNYNDPIMFKPMPVNTSPTKGFTLVELLIIMSIIGVLFAIAVPSYRYAVQRSREAVLKENLYTIRTAINMFHQDKKRYPLDIEELVSFRYLHDIPQDPIARNRLWDPVYDEPQDPDLMDFSGDPMGIIDVRSSAEGQDGEGVPYKEY